jgi:beta-glucosidase
MDERATTSPHPNLDARAVAARADDLLSDLTLEERASLTAGSGPWHTTPVERAGIPAVKMTDGPIGARGDGRSGERALCLPCGSTLGATWDPALLEELGRALGDEARTKGARVLLGPTVNLHRHPLGGRHFECYSEDPLLTARLAVGWIDGVQARGVGASIKHFVANDAEHDRFNVSSDVSARALRELYLVPFEAAVAEADPWTIMAAYNRLDGTFCSQHRWLLTTLLRDEWGYQGLVVSDWGAVHDTVDTARSGLDLQMPGPGTHLGPPLVAAVKEGLVTDADVDRMAANVLRLVVRSGRLDEPDEEPERSDDRPEHRHLARRAAIEGTILLRNVDGLLPLDPSTVGEVALVGPSAGRAQLLGGGSAIVRPHHEVQPVDGFVERLGADRVRHEPGADHSRFLPPLDAGWLTSTDDPDRPVLVEYLANPDGTGDVVHDRTVRTLGARYFGGNVPGIEVERFACRWTTTLVPDASGDHRFGVVATGRVRLTIDDEVVIDTFDGPPPPDPIAGGPPLEVTGTATIEAGAAHRLELLYGREGVVSPPWVQVGVERDERAGDLLARAVDAATRADVAVVVVGTGPDGETEGYDRDSLDLPGRQVELITQVAAANPRTVVGVNAGAPVDLSWAESVPAVVWAGFGGQEMGGALADVVFGDADPGGRLPFTLPVRLEDTPSHAHYPGPPGHLPYDEDVFMGYRGYDAEGVDPRYEFGFGLSYGTTEWAEPTVHGTGTDLVVEVPVTNVGDRPATEVVQLYVHDVEASVPRPPQELKAFAKLHLEPGATATARLALDRRAFAYWSPDAHDWVVEPGAFELRIAASSRAIRHRLPITLP